MDELKAKLEVLEAKINLLLERYEEYDLIELEGSTKASKIYLYLREDIRDLEYDIAELESQETEKEETEFLENLNK